MSTTNDESTSGGAPAPASAESLPGAAFDLADLDRDVVIPRVRRKRLPFLTAALALCMAVGVGAVGGILIQKHCGGSAGGGGGGNGGAAAALAALRAGGGAAGGAGAGGGRGFGGGFGGLGDSTIGTVKAIDGTVLYVTDTTGNTIKVTTQAGIPVRVTKNGTLQDVHPGDTVVVQGTKTGGIVAATSVTIGGAGGGGGFGGRGARAGRGAPTDLPADTTTGTSNGGGSTGGSSQPALPGLGG